MAIIDMKKFLLGLQAEMEMIPRPYNPWVR